MLTDNPKAPQMPVVEEDYNHDELIQRPIDGDPEEYRPEIVGTILLVEDDETLRDMGTELLEELGFFAMTARHGREALETYRERGSEIDAIMLDLKMPVMGGVEAYHELRKIDPSIPIVFCSGYNIESVSDVIGNDEHAGFMHKPYNPEQLRRVLLELIAADCG